MPPAPSARVRLLPPRIVPVTRVVPASMVKLADPRVNVWPVASIEPPLTNDSDLAPIAVPVAPTGALAKVINDVLIVNAVVLLEPIWTGPVICESSAVEML